VFGYEVVRLCPTENEAMKYQTLIALLVSFLASCASQSIGVETQWDGDMNRIVLEDHKVLSDSSVKIGTETTPILVAAVGSESADGSATPYRTELSLGVRQPFFTHNRLSVYAGVGGMLGFAQSYRGDTTIHPGGPNRKRRVEYHREERTDIPIDLYVEAGINYALTEELGLSARIEDRFNLAGENSDEDFRVMLGLSWSF